MCNIKSHFFPEPPKLPSINHPLQSKHNPLYLILPCRNTENFILSYPKNNFKSFSQGCYSLPLPFFFLVKFLLNSVYINHFSLFYIFPKTFCNSTLKPKRVMKFLFEKSIMIFHTYSIVQV